MTTQRPGRATRGHSCMAFRTSASTSSARRARSSTTATDDGQVGPGRLVGDAGQVRLDGQPGRGGGGAGGGGGRGDVADQVAVGDRQHSSGQLHQLGGGLEHGERGPGRVLLGLGEPATPGVLLLRRVAGQLHRLGDGRERRLVVRGGLQAGVALRVGRRHDLAHEVRVCLVGGEAPDHRDERGRQRGLDGGGGAGSGSRHAGGQLAEELADRLPVGLLDLVRSAHELLTAVLSTVTRRPLSAEQPRRRQPRSELSTASSSAASRSSTVRRRSCRRPSSSSRPRSTPGRQPEVVGRGPPPAPDAHGEVGRGGLGQLAVLVDHDDVVGLRVPEGPRQVDVAAGRLVLEPRAAGVHRVVVQRETHRPGAGGGRASTRRRRARPGTAGSVPAPGRDDRRRPAGRRPGPRPGRNGNRPSRPSRPGGRDGGRGCAGPRPVGTPASPAAGARSRRGPGRPPWRAAPPVPPPPPNPR